ncbi:MAG: DUF4838 domain-containing protein, partial [Draconibacterium sp.]|nr:DUF4838 domain-containing protein [Draconibacterium sp.]
ILKNTLKFAIVLTVLMCNCKVKDKQQVILVKNGSPVGLIILPEQTELEKLIDEKTHFLLQESQNQGESYETLHAIAIKSLEVKWKANQVSNSAPPLQDEELMAAHELQEFIKKISGATLEIKRMSSQNIPNTSALLIGEKFAKTEGFIDVLDSLDKDGILLATKGNKIIISGTRARGTLYAAYAFLESLGVYWVMPGDFGEIYPRNSTIESSINKTENPSFSQRYWWNTGGEGNEFALWSLRNKGNYVKALDDQKIAQSHALSKPLIWGAQNPKYGIKTKVFKQDLKTGEFLKDANGNKIAEIVAKLPEEYYAIYDNQVQNNSPNMSNPKVWEMYAEYYIDWFKNQPEQDYVSISAEDGLVRDSRKASQELSSMEFDWIQGDFSATDRLWFFHNRVIEKVVKVFPDKKFGVYIYSNNTLAPRIERVHPNMALVYAPLSVCPLHNVRDEKCKTNVMYRKSLESWAQQAKAVGAESYYYDYMPLGFQWNVAMVCPQWAIMGKNYPYFHQLGLNGFTTQGFDDWGSSHFNNWVAIRLYWNANQNYKNIIANYCTIRYGKAAPAVIEYCDILEKRMAEIPDLCSNEIWGNHLILTPEVREKCRNALEKANKLVKEGREKVHLETLVDMQMSTDAWCDGIEIARNEGDYGKAMKFMEKSFEIQNKLNKLYSHFVSPETVNRESLQRFTAGGWFNKYKSFDEKIKSSSSHIILPQYMKVALDTDNTAWTKGWQKPQVSVDELDEWDSTVVPDIKYGTQREVAAFFYRCEVKIPKNFNTEKTKIFFPSIIARALQIWINGEPIEIKHDEYNDTIFRGPPTFWYNYNHELEFEISTMLKPGEKNTIAFRIFKSLDHAGTYDRIFLLAE